MEYNFSIAPLRPVPLTYESAIAEIDALEARGWRLGLDRMAAFCTHAGLDPFLGVLDRPKYIHVAGTNGKGSTNAFVESIFRSAGFKTGAFYSPFVQDYRERFQSEGRLISREDLTRFTEGLFRDVDTFADSEYGGITKFEFEAALGFKYWGESGCDWVALEVGLGGRLDATNVVHPSCSIIVSIGLDHTAILGDTLAKIAGEKAGIVKPGVPVVIGQMPDEAREVIEAKAAENGCEVWRFGREILLEDGFIFTPRRTHLRLTPGLVGTIQSHNMALAVAAADMVNLEISDESIRQGVESATVPGRFEERVRGGVRYVIDGAHNPDAAHK